MTLLFKYYNHKAVADISQAEIEQYLQYIKEVHKVGWAKCRSVAQACSFFFKRYYLPLTLSSQFYPKKQFILPKIMTEEEVIQLFAAPLTLKEYCVIGLWNGDNAWRIGEVGPLRLQDIESHNKRLKVYQAQRRQRQVYTAAQKLLQQLRQFYVQEGRPKNIYLPANKPKGPCMYAVCKW